MLLGFEAECVFPDKERAYPLQEYIRQQQPGLFRQFTAHLGKMFPPDQRILYYECCTAAVRGLFRFFVALGSVAKYLKIAPGTENTAAFYGVEK